MMSRAERQPHSALLPLPEALSECRQSDRHCSVRRVRLEVRPAPESLTAHIQAWSVADPILRPRFAGSAVPAATPASLPLAEWARFGREGKQRAYLAAARMK